MKFDFDVIVIGAWSGGLTVANGLVGVGKKVALVEKWSIGGDCTNYWCIPSKAFLDISRNLSWEWIQKILQEVRKRRKKIQDEETPEIVRSTGIHLYQWAAKMVSKNEVEIGSTKISWRYIVIATGSRAQWMEIPWVAQTDILDNKSIFELEEPIKDIVIIGGGYIWCELAEAFQLSWVQVHLIQRNTFLIPREEEEVSLFMANYLQEIWVHLYLWAKIWKAQWKVLEITFWEHQNAQIPFDKVLVALWRIPSSENLWLQDIWVKVFPEGIEVDRYMRTNLPHIFALWDVVKGNPQFTHLANHEGRNIIRNIAFPYILSRVSKKTIPSCLYTHYEVARVGETKKEISSKLSVEDFVTCTYYFSKNDRSKVTEDEKGFIMLHCRRLSWKILWATIVSKHAGEMLPIITLAMQKNISAFTLSQTIFSYPTKAEAIKKVCDVFVIETLRNLKINILYALKKYILYITPFLVWGIILALFFYFKTVEHLSYENIAFALYRFFSNTGFVWIISFILIYALRPVVLFPASFMSLMSGAIWGPVYGLIFSLIGSNLSWQTWYFMGRFLWKNIIPSWEKNLIFSSSNTKKNPLIFIIGCRLLFLPYDGVSYFAWFLKTEWKSYTLGTLFWTFPWSLAIVLAGSSFYGVSLVSFAEARNGIHTSLLYFSAVIFIISIVISKILKKKFTS